METFELQLKDLSEANQEQIREITDPYTVPIVINGEHGGSGTLIEVDGMHGVLTAEHVIRNPDKPNHHLDKPTKDGPWLLIPPAKFPGGKSLHAKRLELVFTKRVSDEYGPDLGCILIPPGEILEGLKARRSFYPVSTNIGDRVKNGAENKGFVAFSGFPAKAARPAEPVLGYEQVTSLKGFAFITAPDRYEIRQEWDYFELGINRKEIDDLKHTFGGVSGGGVWRVPVYRKKSDGPGAEFIKDVTLTGVAFFEDDPKDQFFVRTHGPRSLYERFLPLIRAKIAEIRSRID